MLLTSNCITSQCQSEKKNGINWIYPFAFYPVDFIHAPTIGEIWSSQMLLLIFLLSMHKITKHNTNTLSNGKASATSFLEFLLSWPPRTKKKWDLKSLLAKENKAGQLFFFRPSSKYNSKNKQRRWGWTRLVVVVALLSHWYNSPLM